MLKPLLTCLIALAVLSPATAGAATITMEGDTLVYRADPGETNHLRLYPARYAGVQIGDSGASRLAVRGVEGCYGTWGGEEVECPSPARIRVELGDGDDHNDFGTTFPAIPVEVQGGDGDDRLKANEFRPTPVVLDGGPGNDYLDGYAQPDVIRGGPGDDTLNGLAGDDVLEGGEGDDRLRPDHGATTIGRDVVDGGPGFDTVVDWADTAAQTHPPVTVTADGVANDGRPGEQDNILAVEGVVSAVSGTFVMSDTADDEVVVQAYLDEQPSTVEGRGGSDRLEGDDAQETLDGGAGDDRLEGGFNHDTIIGGPGRDVIFGDDTDDQCGGYGQSCTVPFGNDTIHARDGEADQVDCGLGDDAAVVDSIDVVSSCERVDAAAPPAPAPVGVPVAAPAPGVTPTLSVSRVRLAAALRRGLKVTVAGAAPGRSRAVLRRGRRAVAAGRLTVAADGRGVATLRFTAAGRRALRRQRTARLVLRAAGVRRVVTLRR